MAHRPWRFEVLGIEKITDGDTFWLVVDVGFRQTQLTQFRLNRYDTPEIWRPKSDFEATEAKRARNFVIEWLNSYMGLSDSEVWATTYKDPGSFGRWLADFEATDSTGFTISHLGDELRAQDLATVWPTRWREEFDNG